MLHLPLKKQGIPPPPDPEVVKAETELKMQQAKAQSDMQIAQQGMKLKQDQAVLDAQIKLAEHKADMQCMGEKHQMTMQHGQQQAMQKMGQSALEHTEGKEGAHEHPIMALINAVVVSNQQNQAMMQRFEQAMTAAAVAESAPKTITMKTSNNKLLTATVTPQQPVMQ